MACPKCGSGMYPNGRYWTCANGACGNLIPLGYNDTPLELKYRDTHGWFFVQSNGHLFTIDNKTRWTTQEAAVDAITRLNERLTAA